MRARPKKIPKPKRASFRTPTTRISERNLKKLFNELSRRTEPRSPPPKSFERFSLYDTMSDVRIIDLSQSKNKCCCDCDFCQPKTVLPPPKVKCEGKLRQNIIF